MIKKSFHPIIIKVGSGRRSSGGVVDMDYEFQRIAKNSWSGAVGQNV